MVLTWIVSSIFTFGILDNNVGLAQQWEIYINPFNSLYLFCSGVFLFRNFKNIQLKTSELLFSLVVLVILFWFVPVSGDPINLVTGYNRFILSLICIIIVFLFWKIDFHLPRIIEKPLESFGVATYSVYLLHPFIFSIVGSVLPKMHIQGNTLLIAISVVATITSSLIVYRFYEQPFILLGKKVTNQTKQMTLNIKDI